MLAALELSLSKGDDHLDYCINKYTGQELLNACKVKVGRSRCVAS